MSDEKPRTGWMGIKLSRRGTFCLIGVILIAMMTMSFSIALAFAASSGRMTWEAAMNLGFGTMLTGSLGAVVVVFKYSDGVTKEDVAKSAAGASQGDGESKA